MLTRILSILLSALLLIPSVSLAETPTEVFKVEKVQWMNGDHAARLPIEGGTEADALIILKSNIYKTEDMDKLGEVSFVREKDSFSGNDKGEIRVISEKGEALSLEISLKKIVYSGHGNKLNYQLKGNGLEQKGSIQLKDLKPISDETPSETPQPQALITRSEMKNLPAGESVALSIQVKNVGATTMKSPVARLKSSEGLSFTSGGGSRLLNDIEPGKSASFSVTIQASEQARAKQSLDVEIAFNYDSGQGMRQASLSDTLDIPVEEKKDQGEAPLLILSHAKPDGALKAGEDYPLTLRIKNDGKMKADNVVVALSASDGIQIKDNQSTHALGDIEKGGSKELAVNLQAGDKLEAAQRLQVALRYQYNNSGGVQKENQEESISLALAGDAKADGGGNATDSLGGGGDEGGSFSSGISTPKLDSAVPNVIITKFSYGGKPVAAGEAFELNMEYTNTSPKIAVENIVLTVETGEDFGIESASNTSYIASMAANSTQKQNLKMRALPSAKTGGRTIEVTFKYEYIDNDKRSQSSITQKLSIPIYQPDRFEIKAPELPESVNAGEELTLSLPYVNKGKSEVSNVEATLEGSVPTETKQQNLGNFEAGKSGTITFLVTPDTAGKLDFKLKVSYEDPNQEIKSKEFPVSINVLESKPEESDVTVDMPEEPPKSGIGKYIVGAVLLLAAGGGGYYFYRRKKAKAEPDWDDEE